jgi:hypothetical protein
MKNKTNICYVRCPLRDRPFNLKGYGFLYRSEICFQTTQELEYLFFLWRKARIFFPILNIRLYDKNSESDYFFFLHQNQNIFFQQHWKSEYCFSKKNITPPPSPPLKLNGRYLMYILVSTIEFFWINDACHG